MLSIVLLLLAQADDFARLEGRPLADLPGSPAASPREALTIADLGSLPNVLSGVRSPVVVVKTDEKNPARMLVSPGFRNPPGGRGEPVPILVVERFDTFEGGSATRRIARGRDLILFDGFRLDLDTGQVVPEGQGGDVQFVASGEGGPRLVAIKPAAMFTLTKSPLPKQDAARPSAGRAVAKSDFAGTYRLFANGQTSGRLELAVDDEGVVSGRLRSDQTGGAYKVTGQVAAEAPNKIRFAAEMPRTRPEYDGYLFVEGKGAIAGTFQILGRTFGFFAVREGGPLVPDGEEQDARPLPESEPGTLMIEVSAEGTTLDGKPADEAAITAAMKAALADNPSAGARIKAAPDVPASKLLGLVERLREAGASRVRIGPR